jgi:hypothetical protein
LKSFLDTLSLAPFCFAEDVCFLAILQLHKFANVISFLDRRRLIIDPVVRDPSSISMRVLAHLDIHALNDPLLVQRIVYDDDESWVAADLNMLGMAATPVPFSKSMEVIERLAS